MLDKTLVTRNSRFSSEMSQNLFGCSVLGRSVDRGRYMTRNENWTWIVAFAVLAAFLMGQGVFVSFGELECDSI
jgi:hypothetical protein